MSYPIKRGVVLRLLLVVDRGSALLYVASLPLLYILHVKDPQNSKYAFPQLKEEACQIDTVQELIWYFWVSEVLKAKCSTA